MERRTAIDDVFAVEKQGFEQLLFFKFSRKQHMRKSLKSLIRLHLFVEVLNVLKNVIQHAIPNTCDIAQSTTHPPSTLLLNHT